MSKEIQFSMALVTGASSGIGEALCHLLANKGIPLLITGRDRNKLEHLATKLRKHITVISLSADLGKPEERKMVIEMIGKHSPDLVINNAGLGLYGDVLSHSTDKQMEILKINGEAVLEITVEAARNLKLRNRSGVILNVASSAAFQVFPQLAVYAAAKTFVTNFSESFDQEMKPYGIRILTACPGMVKTAFSKRAGSSTITKLDEQLAMAPKFAAKEIWLQIQKGKAVHLFDWKYRLFTYLGVILPKSWRVAILQRSIENKLKL